MDTEILPILVNSIMNRWRANPRKAKIAQYETGANSGASGTLDTHLPPYAAAKLLQKVRLAKKRILFELSVEFYQCLQEMK